ncbi:MAG: 1-deoxy-D-xylulose-5-phosphate reductoisomerase, partial [Acidobacteriia bacterium 12-62-4]
MKTLTLLGSTGSIGTSTLDVVRRRRDEFSVYALVAGSNLDLLVEQIREFAPAVAVVATPDLCDELAKRLAEVGIRPPQLASGAAGRLEAAIAPEVDIVMSAIVGVAGLEATYQAVRKRKVIGLANKEVLVASGQLVMEACRETGTEMIPVDSEHNGAHQCLRAGRRDEVTKLILTASGGPFRRTSKEELEKVTVAQA